MCAVKVVAVVLVVLVLVGAALWYLQPPTGHWIVDQQAMKEEGEDDLVSRFTDTLIRDIEIELATDGRVDFLDGEDKLFSGTWKLEDGNVKFEDCGVESAKYTRPDRLTVEFMGKTILFKRR
jgi:hypothetical protein